MATQGQIPQISPKTQTIITSVTLGFKLLPFFIQGIETLFGKKTGVTKKAAVNELFNAAVIGTAAGYGLAGDTQVSNAITTLQPTVSAAIDALAGQFFPSNTSVVDSQVAG